MRTSTSHPNLMLRLHAGLALCALLLVAPGCRGDAQADVVDRVWVNAKPQDSRSAFSGMLISGREGQRTGVFHRGSLYKGAWELFSFTPKGDKAATLTFLQDGSSHALSLKSCKAPEGFDLCLRIDGDPSGVGTWYSKNSWALRRKKKKASGGPELQVAMQDTLSALLQAPGIHQD